MTYASITYTRNIFVRDVNDVVQPIIIDSSLHVEFIMKSTEVLTLAYYATVCC